MCRGRAQRAVKYPLSGCEFCISAPCSQIQSGKKKAEVWSVVAGSLLFPTLIWLLIVIEGTVSCHGSSVVVLMIRLHLSSHYKKEIGQPLCTVWPTNQEWKSSSKALTSNSWASPLLSIYRDTASAEYTKGEEGYFHKQISKCDAIDSHHKLFSWLICSYYNHQYRVHSSFDLCLNLLLFNRTHIPEVWQLGFNVFPSSSNMSMFDFDFLNAALFTSTLICSFPRHIAAYWRCILIHNKKNKTAS